LAELNRKALSEILEKNISHLNRVLEALNIEEHSLSVVTILLAKMSQPWNSATHERILQTIAQVELWLPLFNQCQLQWAPDLFVALIRRIAQYFLRKNEQVLLIRGIRLLLSAISIFAPEPGVLTSLHSYLFCLSLRTRIYEPSIPFLETPITKIFKETSSQSNIPNIDSKWVLLYFYYGGLILGSLGRLRECLLMMENVICIPSIAISAVVVEAYKKYILISMILFDQISPLPSYRSSLIPRNVRKLCADYTSIETICQNNDHGPDVALSLIKHLEQHRKTFEMDGNVGLVKRLIRKIRENSILKIAKCFSVISIDDFVRRGHLDNAEHALRYLTEMSDAGKLVVRIDQQNRIIRLDEVKTQMNDDRLEEALRRVMELDKLINEFDVSYRTNALYINRSLASSAKSASQLHSSLALNDSEGFQQSTSSQFGAQSMVSNSKPSSMSNNINENPSSLDLLWPS
uniref:COP9 signalosome complex subunit 3 n=1 Tax=Anisakis simplex TaxID=6269 RepID=A0A0M3JYK4_ANISI